MRMGFISVPNRVLSRPQFAIARANTSGSARRRALRLPLRGLIPLPFEITLCSRGAPTLSEGYSCAPRSFEAGVESIFYLPRYFARLVFTRFYSRVNIHTSGE
jgi:hypothetical protein